jgi:hypothetical protein
VQQGATIAELANAFGVCIATIWNWKVTYPEFNESCRLGLEAATERVERSMFERAVGYTHDSVKIFLPAGANQPVFAPYLKHVPPDPRAGEFWLTNRAPDRWKNKQNTEHNEAADSPLRLLAEQISGKRHSPAASRAESYRAHRHRAEGNPPAAARRSRSYRN